jgi:excisionase family DNA binding protein
MGKSACWSYVTWYNECSGGNWATWEPGEVVRPGDVGRFDRERRFRHWETLDDYGIGFTVSRELPVAPHHYASGKAFRVETKAAGKLASGMAAPGRLDAGFRITAKREHACLLQLQDATESRVNETRSMLTQIAALLRAGKWDIDLMVVAKRIRARGGFAAISQGAGQSIELRTAGSAGLAEVLEAGSAELILASDYDASGFLLYEFGSRETPVFFPPVRVKQALWDRLLPWRADGPWLIDPAGGRHDPRHLPNDLSDLAPEARRYDSRRSPMTASEFDTMPVEDLFELVSSLPDEDDFENPPIPFRGRNQGARTAIPAEAPESTIRPSSPEISSGSAAETPLSDVRFLTVPEVATIMRVSKMTVYRLVHSGELEAIRVGRSFRVPEQAVNQYLRAAFIESSSAD